MSGESIAGTYEQRRAISSQSGDEADPAGCDEVVVVVVVVRGTDGDLHAPLRIVVGLVVHQTYMDKPARATSN